MTNCADGTDDCCTSLIVTGGTFYRTYANLGREPTNEADQATVATFRLDKYDVTVGRFRQFAMAVSPPDGGSGWLPAAGSGKHTHLNGGRGLTLPGGGFELGWDPGDNSRIAPTDIHLSYCQGNGAYATWAASPGSDDVLPINCVTWWEAWAFCIWDGGFLPSEAEWEYAAAGGNQQREYPWGSLDPGITNEYAIYACQYPSAPRACSGAINIAPVGTAKHGAGVWGQLDLVGNLWQWVADYYVLPYGNPCINCAAPSPTSLSTPNRAVRGGDFLHATDDLHPEYRNYFDPSTRTGYSGFRCARTP